MQAVDTGRKRPTVISANQFRWFLGNNIIEQTYDETFRSANEEELVGGRILFNDSTHVKAKANKHK
jgi:hypothetical protein